MRNIIQNHMDSLNPLFKEIDLAGEKITSAQALEIQELQKEISGTDNVYNQIISHFKIQQMEIKNIIEQLPLQISLEKIKEQVQAETVADQEMPAGVRSPRR